MKKLGFTLTLIAVFVLFSARLLADSPAGHRGGDIWPEGSFVFESQENKSFVLYQLDYDESFSLNMLKSEMIDLIKAHSDEIECPDSSSYISTVCYDAPFYMGISNGSSKVFELEDKCYRTTWSLLSDTLLPLFNALIEESKDKKAQQEKGKEKETKDSRIEKRQAGGGFSQPMKR